MCFLLDVVLVGCSSVLCMLLPFLSPGQCLVIVPIIYSFVLDLELSYLDKKGKCRNSFC